MKGLLSVLGPYTWKIENYYFSMLGVSMDIFCCIVIKWLNALIMLREKISVFKKQTAVKL